MTPALADPPPGVVIDHRRASSRVFIGSPSICILPDGDYLASHDWFGPGTKEHERGTGRVFRSADKGATWKHVADMEGFFWQGLFVHRGAAYVMGTDRHHGRLVIRRSRDKGTTWTEPLDGKTGVIAEAPWHTAPVPVIENNGRLWRAVEDAMNGNKWGERYRARMASVPVDADLLDAANWTLSNPLPRDPAWLGGKFRAWLEGNAVVDPGGGIVNVLRIDLPEGPEMAALVRISADGATASFDATDDIVEMPGGAKKFTIRKDPSGPGFWTLATVVLDTTGARGRAPAGIRNALALMFSEDLRKWKIRRVLLHHPDEKRHGFQYADWQYDGEDLIAVCRTAWDDETGGAPNNHDANFMTFHRWHRFRSFSREEVVPDR